MRPSCSSTAPAGLCNRSVALLARHDRAGRLRFAHLQGPTAARLLAPAQRSVASDGTVVLLEPSGRVSVRSAAVLHALAYTGSGWRAVARVLTCPGARSLLDVAYGFVARRRDRWFGRAESCALPDPALRARFLDQA
jgi:predicted DCC family thiol-disulfide oxidoreductase YuxK